MLSILELRLAFNRQRRLKRAGVFVPAITSIAKRAGLHRDTIYALLVGDRVCQRTQYALSRVLQEIEVETRLKPETKLMSLSFNQGGVGLNMGLANRPLFNRRLG